MTRIKVFDVFLRHNRKLSAGDLPGRRRNGAGGHLSRVRPKVIPSAFAGNQKERAEAIAKPLGTP